MRIRAQIAVIALLLIFTGSMVHAQTAEEWIDRVDDNMLMSSAEYLATMMIHLPSGQERTFSMNCKVVGEKFALIEYVQPKRDAGTRYLKRDDELWIYFPRVDRTMLIQGHMLRQEFKAAI